MAPFGSSGIVGRVDIGDGGAPTGNRPIEGWPIAGGVAACAGAVLVGGALAAAQAHSPVAHLPEVAGQVGMVGVTVALLAATAVAWRGFRGRSRLALAVAPAVVLAGGIWPWLTFVAADSLVAAGFRPALDGAVAVLAAPFAALLLARGFRSGGRLEAFGGVGFTALLLAAVIARSAPTAAVDSPAVALLAALGAAAVLCGAVVDLRVAERRSIEELRESRRRVEAEVLRAEGILHDLRSGLLAIEAAVGSVGGELAEVLRAEAARLRRLTAHDDRRITPFDLVERVRGMVAARRAAGLAIDFLAPPSAPVVAEETEVLSIVDNLLSNAERHGRGLSVRVEIGHRSDSTVVTVSNGGPAIELAVPEAVFDRGTTTHPGGSGVGLSHSRVLASLNDAELTLCPAEGGRTAFALALPGERRQPVGAGGARA